MHHNKCNIMNVWKQVNIHYESTKFIFVKCGTTNYSLEQKNMNTYIYTTFLKILKYGLYFFLLPFFPSQLADFYFSVNGCRCVEWNQCILAVCVNYAWKKTVKKKELDWKVEQLKLNSYCHGDQFLFSFLCSLWSERSQLCKVWLHFLIWKMKTLIFLISQVISDANLIGFYESHR